MGDLLLQNPIDNLACQQWLWCIYVIMSYMVILRMLLSLRWHLLNKKYSFISKNDVCKNDTSYLDICEEDKAFINYILDNYAGFSGTELEAMTHKEQPWIEARHGIGPMESCNEVISEDTMRNFYGKKWNEINS